MSDRELSRRAGEIGHWLKMAALVVLALVGLVLVAQNTHVVTLRLLAWEVTMSLIVLLPAVILGAFVAGYLVGRLGGRRRDRRRTAVNGRAGEGREADSSAD